MIDFHAHIFPDKIAHKTVSHLESICGTPAFSDGTKEMLLKSMDEAGIECSILLPVLTSPSQFESVLRFFSQFTEGRLISFGGIHPDNEDYKEKLRLIRDYGLKGIKLHSDYQNTYFSDIKYKRIISYATELGLICVIHAGQDPYSPEDIHCTPKMISEMVEEVAPEKLVLAHMGGHLMPEDVEKYIIGKNVYFDMSYDLDKIPTYQMMKLIRSHGADKVLFGTDSPWASQKDFVNVFNKLPLTDWEKKLIAEDNAKNLLKDCV